MRIGNSFPFVLGIATIAIGGCVATYDRTDLTSVSQNPELPSTITGRHIQLAVGGVVTAHVAPFNTDDNPMVGDVVSEDTSVLEVSRSFGDRNYAFLGRHAGKTVVELKADGVIVGSIEAEVTEQPPR